MSSLSEFQKREVAAMIAQVGVHRRALVIAYQAQPPMAKCVIQPVDPDVPIDQQPDTGWIPVLSQSIGAGWQQVSGLSANMQVLLAPEEGDGAHYAVIGRYYSDIDAAPEHAETEIVFQHQSGAKLALNADGSISALTPNITIAAPEGDVQMKVQGTLNVTGDLQVGDIESYLGHLHQDDGAGPPQAGT